MSWDHKKSVKELIRHIIFNIGAGRLLLLNKKRNGHIIDHLSAPTPEERFSMIYNLGVWVHSQEQEALSGLGSEIRFTSKIIQELPSLLERLGSQHLLDVGCGDWSWMQAVKLPCDYIGVDIVPEVIRANRRHERQGVSFAVADAITGPLPKADVGLCREVLFHLSLDDGLAALANMKNSVRWLVATTNPSLWFNSDIATGDFREINLQRPPYCLPPPRERIFDDGVQPGRILAVWAVEDIPGIRRKALAKSASGAC
ncbi:SAM-dependent methyltransferase [Azospirillum fermentarium]|uniref:class I SAM-dependent methyltransferase n=1 Tax=Azospirillum fermentarium TaxID=1233114 RepID=UPI002227D672|nr:class I SAM-dependent methyltransferase [Azospirillum fermentarium]MCW2245192.1 SAM-dependent methyltransferase [Azospirillum fermentarium]